MQAGRNLPPPLTEALVYGSWQNWLIAALTLTVVLVLNHKAKGICKLGVREYTKQSGPHAGETGQSNEVQRFLPPPAPKAAPSQGWTQGAF